MFASEETRPARFPNHGAYPVQSEAVKQALCEAIDHHITTTDLTVWPHR